MGGGEAYRVALGQRSYVEECECLLRLEDLQGRDFS